MPVKPSRAGRRRSGSEDAYREKWSWDTVYWGTHCVNCSPGNCPYRVYVKDGVVVREEQAGAYGTIEPGVPDMNPMGCQKGAAWSRTIDAEERLLHPLRRAGERGEGKWQRVSWDEALTDVADGIIDAVRDAGPQSILEFATTSEGGAMARVPAARFFGLVGAVSTDTNADIADFNAGLYETFGQAAAANSVDAWFHAETTLIWHRNPVYTAIPHYHYIAESRYRGGHVVTIAPDANPSTLHADYYVPVTPGADAALALAMCRVIIDEGLVNERFIREQTDLPFLVRSDTGRFLRQTDLEGTGRDDQFYVYDSAAGRPVEAPRGTLALAGTAPAIEGRFRVALSTGEAVEAVPVYELLRQRLAEYGPESAGAVCGTHPEVIRKVARMVAKTRTTVLLGFNSGKYYHGDLMERAITLLLALTGNWGRKGTGIGNPIGGMFDGSFLFPRKRSAGQAETQQVHAMRSAFVGAMKAQDPTITDEMASIGLLTQGAPADAGGPSALFWYHHTGHRERWNRKEWGDPTMARSFDEYFDEAMEKGWWRGLDRPPAGVAPLVAFEVGGNALRKTRGGRSLMLQKLWPGLRMMVTVDWRMTATGQYSDIVLPVAVNHEKVSFPSSTQWMLQLTVSEKATEPAGETKSEWEIFTLLAGKLEERARAREFTEYADRFGATRKFQGLLDTFTAGGELVAEEQVAADMVADTAVSGNLPDGTSLDSLRQSGFVRYSGWGITPFDAAQASELKPDETHTAMRGHVEKHVPYPTLTRRAQFYIDHEWFLEAGEQLPVHKENPRMGGDYPLAMTGGHNRWSIHSVNIMQRLLLNTHRGRPHVVLNPADAAARGVADGEDVRVFNDVGSCEIPAKVSPSVRPGQVIVYNGWDPTQFRQWSGPMDLEPGMVKWLQFAGGYGHLRYWIAQWQPVPADRGTRVEVEKASCAAPARRVRRRTSVRGRA